MQHFTLFRPGHRFSHRRPVWLTTGGGMQRPWVGRPDVSGLRLVSRRACRHQARRPSDLSTGPAGPTWPGPRFRKNAI